MSFLEAFYQFPSPPLQDYIKSFKPCPSTESFANQFVAQNEKVLGSSATLEPWGKHLDGGLLFYELSKGKTLSIGIMSEEGRCPEAIIGV